MMRQNWTFGLEVMKIFVMVRSSKELLERRKIGMYGRIIQEIKISRCRKSTWKVWNNNNNNSKTRRNWRKQLFKQQQLITRKYDIHLNWKTKLSSLNLIVSEIEIYVFLSNTWINCKKLQLMMMLWQMMRHLQHTWKCASQIYLKASRCNLKKWIQEREFHLFFEGSFVIDLFDG